MKGGTDGGRSAHIFTRLYDLIVAQDESRVLGGLFLVRCQCEERFKHV